MVKYSPEDMVLRTENASGYVKTTAYGRLLAVLRGWPKEITLENVHEIRRARYVGSSGYMKIKEGLEDMQRNPERDYPTCSRLEMYRRDPDSQITRSILELTKVHGVGKATALRWYRDFGITNLADLREASTTRNTPSGRRFKVARAGNDDCHPMTRNQQICLELLDEIQEPMGKEERDHFIHLLQPIFTRLKLKCEVVGGMRRVKPGCPYNQHHDLDLLITLDAKATSQEDVCKFLPRECMDSLLKGLDAHIIANLSVKGLYELKVSNKRKSESEQHHVRLLLMRNGQGKARRIDLVVVPPRHWPYALLGWTGSTQFERSIKDYAKNYFRGREDHSQVRELVEGDVRFILTNSMLALVSLKPGAIVDDDDIYYSYDKCETERDIFDTLGLRYLEPWQRCC